MAKLTIECSCDRTLLHHKTIEAVREFFQAQADGLNSRMFANAPDACRCVPRAPAILGGSLPEGIPYIMDVIPGGTKWQPSQSTLPHSTKPLKKR